MDKDFDDIDVLPLVEAADVVGFSDFALMENQVDGPGMVLDIEPVTDILALAIDRQRLAMADVVDKQRNQLLRELVGTIVIGAVKWSEEALAAL